MLDSSSDLTRITEDLNEQQLKAVTGKLGNYLVLAGAGSGKTRVLVHRIAYLISNFDINPRSILAVTFTNKAAREMRTRIEDLFQSSNANPMICGTFHATASRFLRQYHELTNLSADFQVLDTNEQKKTIQLVMNTMKFNAEFNKPADVANQINRWKDNGERARDVTDAWGKHLRWLDIYDAYQKYCDAKNYLDFGELLLRCFELLSENEDLLQRFRNRYTQILVDEFQDTNTIQFDWIKLLAGDTGNVMVVGDDDQSIYGWRGAVVGNIREFPDSFRNTQTIRLEQNYRSTSNILQAANHLINKNKDRMGKTLWTEAKEGKRISVFEANDEFDEARYLATEISDWVQKSDKNTYDQITVLYRAHYLSRQIESILIDWGIPFTMRGGTPFYDREEIKNAIGFMMMVNNPRSNVGFDRVIGAISLGIGKASEEIIEQLSITKGLSKWETCKLVFSDDNPFGSRLTPRLISFIKQLTALIEECQGKSLKDIAYSCIYDSGLRSHYLKKPAADSESRLENLDELINACLDFQDNFSREHGDTNYPILRAFLEKITLDPGDKPDPEQPSVTLQTLHAAKGLEFSVVFMIGMNEGVFPRYIQPGDRQQLYEERRLAYVGVTRAMEELHLTWATERSRNESIPSRFLKDLPIKQVAKVNRGGKHKPFPKHKSIYLPDEPRKATPKKTQSTRFSVNDQVVHSAFGIGRVFEVLGHGQSERVRVEFEDHSKKVILANIPMLKKRD